MNGPGPSPSYYNENGCPGEDETGGGGGGGTITEHRDIYYPGDGGRGGNGAIAIRMHLKSAA